MGVSPPASPGGALPPVSDSEPASILIVNDDPVVRYVTSRTLRLAGFRTLEAGEGAEALRLAAGLPELILLDVQMPGLNGFEVARRLKANPTTAGILVVHLSGERLDSEAKVRGLEGGADAYLTLPIEPAELVANVRALLRLREQALSAVRRRDAFFGAAAHELRTPLTALALRLQGLLRALERNGGEGLPGAQLREHLSASAQQVERLQRLAGSLLDSARPQRGLPLEIAQVDFSALVHEVVARHRDEAAHAGCPLSLDVEPGVVGYADVQRLAHALEALLSNALKYGVGRPVSLRLRRVDGRAQLSVRDEGIGVPLEAQARIFERFERATESYQGSSLGLGLYLVQQTALAHGGSVRVESRPGAGATFTLEVPLSRSQTY
nr:MULTISPECIES: HAMP domain-containing sensor histidine kinase [Myxococcaceae]